MIDIADDGRGAAAPLLAESEQGSGQGLVGMRERVALYGGTLEAGPVFPGGYRVHASFPLDPVEQGSVATCCDEESALSAVAAAALRERLDRGLRSGPTHAHEPEPLIEPRVVPPLIGRVVPPHPKRPAAPRPSAPKSRKMAP